MSDSSLFCERPYKLAPNGRFQYAANLTIWNVTTPERFFDATLNTQFHDFMTAYCANPPPHTCDYPGRCTNSDAAGVLVRAAAYLSAFFLGNLLQFDSDDIEGAFSTHLLYVYSILISTSISVRQSTLTIFHTEIIVMILGSPLTFSLFVYAIFGSFGYTHRPTLNQILGPGTRTLAFRIFAIGAFVLWLSGVIYTELPRNKEQFSQWRCDPRDGNLWDFIWLIVVLPYFSLVLFLHLASQKHNEGAKYWLLFGIPLAAFVVAVIVSIIFAWRELVAFERTERKRRPISMIRYIWRVLREKFPFLHWLGVHVLPIIYWIVWIELNIYIDSDGVHGHDNHFQLTFGQILAIFVILQPLWANIKLFLSKDEQNRNRFIFWFINLRWMQLLTGRPTLSEQKERKQTQRGELSYYEPVKTEIRSEI